MLSRLTDRGADLVYDALTGVPVARGDVHAQVTDAQARLAQLEAARTLVGRAKWSVALLVGGYVCYRVATG
jgi:hypothetical protein